MTTISECILALLDVSYEQTADEICTHVARQLGTFGGLVAAQIANLHSERWLYLTPEGKYRRRTPAQHAALMAANNPQQGRLM
jgi:hypothetical protein